MALQNPTRPGLGSVLALLVSSCLWTSAAQAGPALLLDVNKGEVLFAEDADETWHPASLTKMITAYMTFEAVKSGKIAWDTNVPLSANARAQPATRIGLRGGIPLNVEQAVRGLILRSANDFAMALAELIGGSEEGFAVLQNETAKRLGMKRTVFKNPHGLPDHDQVTTARDMAILAAAILRDFPDRAEVFSTPQVQIHRQMFHSQNDLLRTLAGADGMKTGFTCASGYNVVATATRGEKKLAVVVLGALTRNTRSQRAAELIEGGFAFLDGKSKDLGGKPVTAVALKDLPDSHPEGTPAHDMSRQTRTWKCGNRGGEPRPVAAKGGAAQKAATQPAKKALAGRAPLPKGAAATPPAPTEVIQ